MLRGSCARACFAGSDASCRQTRTLVSAKPAPVLECLTRGPAPPRPFDLARLHRKVALHRDFVLVLLAPHPLQQLADPAGDAAIVLGRLDPQPAGCVLGQRNCHVLHQIDLQMSFNSSRSQESSITRRETCWPNAATAWPRQDSAWAFHPGGDRRDAPSHSQVAPGEHPGSTCTIFGMQRRRRPPSAAAAVSSAMRPRVPAPVRDTRPNRLRRTFARKPAPARARV